MSTYSGNRRSIRLPGYDYSTAGTYFVTICIQNRACILDEIHEGNINLTDCGEMIKSYWQYIGTHFENIELDAFVVMPNHLHGLLSFGWSISNADRSPSQTDLPSLPKVIQWFKSITTNAYGKQVKDENWPPYPGRLWQRNYWEHVVRSEHELERLRESVDGNPGKWFDDSLYQNHRRSF